MRGNVSGRLRSRKVVGQFCADCGRSRAPRAYGTFFDVRNMSFWAWLSLLGAFEVENLHERRLENP